MAIRTFMSMIRYNSPNDAPLAGESEALVNNPYIKKNFTNLVELLDWNVSSDQVLNIGSQSGGAGAGKITFNELTVGKPVDRLSQQLFGFEAAGIPFKWLDILVVDDQRQPTGSGAEGASLKPYLSYRFLLVGISRIDTVPSDSSVREDMSFQFGGWLIGYQQLKSDGTLTPFAPTGWDRIKNVSIAGSTPPVGGG